MVRGVYLRDGRASFRKRHVAGRSRAEAGRIAGAAWRSRAALSALQERGRSSSHSREVRSRWRPRRRDPTRGHAGVRGRGGRGPGSSRAPRAAACCRPCPAGPRPPSPRCWS
ncbi:hypothetical protein ACFY6U_51360 [Streptomyces sp. NPDC013157]|uniref:hypothetical protein n=1 Tax=Streptomyces sp. NPDC013157 TaxID=3364861 RepID=UPI00369CC362